MFQKIVMLSPKSYILDIVADAESLLPAPKKTVIKMKGYIRGVIITQARLDLSILGVSMKLATKSCFSTSLMEKIALNTISKVDGDEFYSALAQTSTERYIEKAKHAWMSTGTFTIPQPRLRKDKEFFQIFDDKDSVKKLGSRFDKRVLKIPKIFGAVGACEYPSVPFGFKPQR
jgi:hypothetical protein